TNTLRDQFLQIPNVENVTLCFAPPASDNRWGTSITYDNRSETETFSVTFKGADENFLSTFEIDLVAGRNLLPSDTVREFLVNETLVGKLNSSPKEILGKMISMQGGGWKGPVVGVVRDFHDASFKSEISPAVLTTSKSNYYEYAVKINMANASATLSALDKAWSAMYPEQLYEYDFLDQLTAEFYKAEQSILQLIRVFAFVALFIGCMGLYGLVSFMAVQKTKEIGIRKVMGASVIHILWIFGKEFFRLVVIAFLIAAPIGWWIMSRWLENYEYGFNMTGWIFVIEICFISFIALVTVGLRSAKAALINPVYLIEG
ncbi:MAG TPA: FtsX-like permease family protein, partial [Chryseolinea sp.]|nr:FtsX-like permease family protein [Chryseolinea sp.]